MRFLFVLLIFSSYFSYAQNQFEIDYQVLEYMQLNAVDDTISASIGTVGNGELKHGKLMPYKGNNFVYFDKESYLAGRGFIHSTLRNAILSGFDSLETVLPSRYFTIMECSNKEGGEMFPHKTHQNGLSIDFMMPLLKNDKPYLGLDSIGAQHYALDFDDNGNYSKDASIQIDFNTVAQQILIMDYFARQNGLNISKVIIKIEFKEELFATYYGKILKKSGIYVVQGLSPLINALHDEHFHLDFEFTYPKTPQANATKSIEKVGVH